MRRRPVTLSAIAPQRAPDGEGENAEGGEGAGDEDGEDGGFVGGGC